MGLCHDVRSLSQLAKHCASDAHFRVLSAVLVGQSKLREPQNPGSWASMREADGPGSDQRGS